MNNTTQEPLEQRLVRLEQSLRRARRCILALGVVLLLIGTMAAAEGPFAPLVCGALTVKSPGGQTVTTLDQDGNVGVGGKLQVNGDTNFGRDLTVLGKLTVGGVNIAAARQGGPQIKVGGELVCIRGANEQANASLGHKQFLNNGACQTLAFPVPAGRTVLAAWPVIVDYHVRNDVPADRYRRWWKDWAGYFSADSDRTNILVGGTPQDQGYFLIDVKYLYTEK